MAFAKAIQPQLANENVYALINGVYIYREKSVGTKYENIVKKGNTPVFKANDLIGTYTGESGQINGIMWYKVRFTNRYTRNLIAPIFPFWIPVKKSDELEGWVIGTEISTMTSDQMQEFENKQTQKELIETISGKDALETEDKGAFASQNTTSNSGVYWILGIVTVTILGIGAWLTFRKKKVTQPKRVR